nr:MAG TPA: co-chaperone HscB [Caudoviricetes sp.]
MKGKKCWKCKYWTKYFNSNQYFCSRGWCKI